MHQACGSEKTEYQNRSKNKNTRGWSICRVGQCKNQFELFLDIDMKQKFNSN